MNIVFRVHHDELSDTAREYIESRIEALTKLVPLREVYVTYTRDTHHKNGDVAHVEVSLFPETRTDSDIIAEHAGENVTVAFDEVVRKLKAQIEDFKHKREGRERSERRALEE